MQIKVTKKSNENKNVDKAITFNSGSKSLGLTIL